MIYTGGQTLLTRKQLHKIPVPVRPEVTSKWCGIEHGVLADTIVDYVKQVGFKVASETWYCNQSGSALYGAVDINGKGTDYSLDIGQDACFSLGVRHDNSGRYAVSIAVGARVAVCSNGVFDGDFVLKHRHYSDIDLTEIVQLGVEEWMTEAYKVERFIKAMQASSIDEKDASYLIVKTAEGVSGNDHSCLPWAHLQKVTNLWRSPPHEEFAARNVWSLHNAFTEVGKKLSPPKQLRLLKGLRAVMGEYCLN